MTSKVCELGEMRRYLVATQKLTMSETLEVRVFARDLLRELTSPGIPVHEILDPLIRLPKSHLTPLENLLRNTANHVHPA